MIQTTSIRRLIPNTITGGNLLFGCFAIVNALQNNLEFAACCIIISAILDFFDGFAARLLKAPSEVGKELDSLADVVSFGVAPSCMLYTYITNLHITSIPHFAYFAFIIAVFSGFRLAIFNCDTRQTTSFIGLPVPANALFWLSFMLGSSNSTWTTASFFPYLLLSMILFSSWLLISPIPMFGLKFKQFGWKGNELRYLFLANSVLLIIVLHTIGISFVVVLYIILSILTNRYFSKK